MDNGARPTALVAVQVGRAEIIIGRIEDRQCDLELIDALARVHLAALRLGVSLRLHDVSPELYELLQLVGLADLVADETG